MSDIRDRIIDFRRVKAADLLPHPLNFRRHPSEQADAMRAVLERIGYAGACLAYQEPDGSLRLIDGHLRRELGPDYEHPTLVTDLRPEEAEAVLATYDRLGALAEPDAEALDALLTSINESIDAGLLEADPRLEALLADLGNPDFQPVGEDEQGRLDEKAKVTCPECGHVFAP